MKAYPKYCPRCMTKRKGKFCSECGRELVAPANDEEKLTMIVIIVKEAYKQITEHAATSHKDTDTKPGETCKKCYFTGFLALEEIHNFLSEG